MGEVLLVRHGQTDWNVEGRFRGRARIPLNSTGRREAAATAEHIAAHWKRVAAVYSSPVRRAMQTAEPICVSVGRSLRIIDDMADVHYGAWEGLTRAEAEARDPELLRMFLANPARVHIPGGESLLQVQVRAFGALLGAAVEHEREVIVIVAHTEVNRLIILATLCGSIDTIWRLGQGTCAINLLRVEDGAVEVVTTNDRCHLSSIT